jgi:hypothetical protein
MMNLLKSLSQTNQSILKVIFTYTLNLINKTKVLYKKVSESKGVRNMILFYSL